MRKRSTTMATEHHAMKAFPLPADLARGRPLQIIGDGMMPTLQPYRDIAMVKPVDRYVGEGVYAIEQCGGIDLFRVQPARVGVLSLMRDNKIYSGRELTVEEFNAAVLGKVFGKIDFYDSRDYRSFVADRCTPV
jgi:hypothetical protein